MTSRSQENTPASIEPACLNHANRPAGAAIAAVRASANTAAIPTATPSTRQTTACTHLEADMEPPLL